MVTLNRDKKLVFTEGIWDRSYFDDSDWNNVWTVKRTQGGGAWSQMTQPGVQKQKLEWDNNAGAATGGLLHARNRGEPVYVSMYACDSNGPGHHAGICPAVSLLDNGSGIRPDGFYLTATDDGANPRLEVHEVRTGGLFDFIIATEIVTVERGDLLTLWVDEVGGLHNIVGFVNGAAKLTLLAWPGEHLMAGSFHGVYGTGLGAAKQYVSEWWCASGVIP